MEGNNKNLRLEVNDFASSTSASTSSNNPGVLLSPGRVANFKPLALRARTHTTMDIEDLFVGPRDMNHHSKWPFFLRLHGSVVPKMILPLIFVACWATLFTCISKFVRPLTFDSVLLTITGFVVGLALSFRSTTAYERYTDGRKYWAQLMVTGRSLARIIWIHTNERTAQGEAQTKADVLAKLTALNLINAYAVALKHRLRFEPATDYPDLQPLIGNLHTLAGEADQSKLLPKKVGSWKATGEYLGVPFASSNPRKLIKRSRDNLGNLPLEVLNYLGVYLEDICNNGQLKLPIHQTNAMNSLVQMADILTGCERVLNTPVPLAYSISISQITWVYILVLPFQLYDKLKWMTIFGTLLAAYIILGLAAIGYEIENPFGDDVNDLPLDSYCRELASDIDITTSMPVPTTKNFITTVENKVLYPLSMSDYGAWSARSLPEIRAALRAKATTAATSVEFERAKAQSESTNETLEAQLSAPEEAENKERHDIVSDAV